MAILGPTLIGGEIFDKTALPRMLKYALFVAFGMMLSNQDLERITANKKQMLLTSFSSLTLGIITFALFYGFNIFLNYVISILILIGVTVFASVVNFKRNFKSIRYLGKNSLIVYLTHDYAVCAIIIKISKFTDSVLSLTIVSFITALIFSCGVIELSKKIRPLRFVLMPLEFISI